MNYIRGVGASEPNSEINMEVKNISLKQFGFGMLVLIIFVWFVFFVVKPGIIGYTVYKQVQSSDYDLQNWTIKIIDLEKEIILLNANLSVYQKFSQEYENKYNEYFDEFFSCKNELEKLKIGYDLIDDKYINEIEDLNKDILDLEKEIADLSDEYNDLAYNVANNLCCKKKIDNSEVDSYIISNNMIVCSSDGDFDIKC